MADNYFVSRETEQISFMIVNDKYVRRYFLVSVIFFVLFFLLAKFYHHSDKITVEQQKIQIEYFNQNSVFTKTTETIFQALQIDSVLSWENLGSLISDKSIGCYILKGDSLRYWNKNEINLQTATLINEGYTGIYHFEHGWYFCYSNSNNDWRIILFKIIRPDYSISNHYLQNEEEGFSDYSRIDFTYDTLSTDFKITDASGKAIIGLKKKQAVSENSTTINGLFYLWFAGWLFVELLLLRLHLILAERKKFYFRFIFMLFDVALLMIVIGKWFIPEILQNTFWFEHWHQLLPFIDSRGMSVIFVSMILVLSFYLNRLGYKKHKTHKTNNIEAFLLLTLHFFIVFFLLYVFYRFYGYNLKPHDNAIGFLFRRDIIELYFVSGIVISLYMLQNELVKRMPIGNIHLLLYILYALIFSLVMFLVVKLSILFYVSVFFTVILFLLIIKFTSRDSNFIFLRFLLLTVLMALSFSVIINDRYSTLKEKFHVKIVKDLIVNRDSTLEKRFSETANKIRSDKVIKQFITDAVPDETLKEYLDKTYFEHQFRNYYLQFTICHDSDLLEVNPNGTLVNCKQYFKSIKEEPGNKPIDSSLVVMNQEAESRYYLGEIFLGADSLYSSTLYVEMFSSIVPSGLGYPELLVDNSNQVDLTGYSIAKFHHNQLVYKVGEYDYHGSYSFMQPWPNDQFFYLNKHLHYKLRLNSTDVLVVSRPVRSYAEQTATFSLLFLLFSFLAVLLYFVTTGRKQMKLFKYSFRTRLQFFIMVTLMVLFVLMSAISVYYFKEIEKTFIVNQLNEKSKSVLTELHDKFSSEDFLSKSDIDYLQQQLQKFSIVFFTDINIYDRSGELMATSRPKIFEAGLLSTLINPKGYEQIIIENKIFYLTKEQIGKMVYYSAYVPLSFDIGAPVAILNLPYFARQSEVARSFLPMVFNYLNIFVLLGILGAFMALMIAKILTRPLTMLQRSLSEIQIDKKNEPLVWDNDDEIGHLISEYNLMVKKIEESAGLLKRSERETAWREVAQQVAHEIRNPLTPMKLNIQYLQKVYKESKEDFNQKWNSLSSSLIDQIEALNEVASTFSDLASNNTLDRVKVDVVQLIGSAIDIYKNHDKINIRYKTSVDEAYVMARQNELLRVFNNLIKNAVQSILPGKGEVEITISRKDNIIEIKISDNGRGIPDEMKHRIFQPYFTTKSGGTGVGLAIVKNILTEMGGTIDFTSREDEGTEFILRLKAVE